MKIARFMSISKTVFATLTLLAAGCGDKHPNPVESPPAAVDVAQPLARQVADYQVFTARTQAADSVDVKARVTG